MSSLLFSLEATIPVFVLIVIGYLLSRLGVLTRTFCQASDRLVFHLALPVMLFSDMATIDVRSHFDLGFVLFCAVVTSVVFFTIWGVSKKVLKDKTQVGEFVQVSYRSSAAILGSAILKGIYGSSSMAPLMILGAVPLFNVYAVLVLSLEGPRHGSVPLREKLAASFLSVLKNPIILGIFAGLIASLLGIHSFPTIIDRSLSSLSSLATPLALLSIGVGFQGKKAIASLRLSATASALKLLLLPSCFLPLAVYYGFLGPKLLSLMVMLGSASTPTCYIMAKNLGHDGTLSRSTIVLTTLLSSFTLTFWIFLIHHLGYLA